MLLLDQHVVFDVADRERTALADQPQHLAQVRGPHLAQPSVALTLVTLHGRNKEAQMLRGHIGQCMGPIFEDALIDALRMAKIRAAIFGNTVPENVVMAALDDIDGVDLHIAKMVDRGGDRLRAIAERNWRVELLSMQPNTPGLSLGQGNRFLSAGHRPAM